MKRWIIAGGAVVIAVAFSLIIVLIKANMVSANCQPPVTASNSVATPTDAQKQYASTHTCGDSPRPAHNSTVTIP